VISKCLLQVNKSHNQFLISHLNYLVDLSHFYINVFYFGLYLFCSFLFYGPEDGSKHGVTAPPRSASLSNSGPLTFGSGLNSTSPSSHSVSETN